MKKDYTKYIDNKINTNNTKPNEGTEIYRYQQYNDRVRSTGVEMVVRKATW